MKIYEVSLKARKKSVEELRAKKRAIAHRDAYGQISVKVIRWRNDIFVYSVVCSRQDLYGKTVRVCIVRIAHFEMVR